MPIIKNFNEDASDCEEIIGIAGYETVAREIEDASWQQLQEKTKKIARENKISCREAFEQMMVEAGVNIHRITEVYGFFWKTGISQKIASNMTVEFITQSERINNLGLIK